jgi:hypothetical protein
MDYRFGRTAVAVFVFAALASTQYANAADIPDSPSTLPVKAVKPVPDLPFFFVNDNRVTYSYMPKGTEAGLWSVQPDGSLNAKTAKSVYSFTHFDAWAYGTNFITLSLDKADHNVSASPCTNTGVLLSGAPANCAGMVEAHGYFRSTFGWNELFNTNAFTMGPLHNISFEVGANGALENTFLAPADFDFAGGLQFAFDLPYKGYFNVAPLAWKGIGHTGFGTCGALGPGVPGVTCLIDGDLSTKLTWAVETNYYMDLGFLPPSVQFFAISGRFAWYGPKGGQDEPLPATGVGTRFSTATKTEFNSEPIRLTFDASKAFIGPKYSHFVDLWVSYRYWQNKYGLDANASPNICTVKATGVSNGSCTESTIYAGITAKF